MRMRHAVPYIALAAMVLSMPAMADPPDFDRPGAGFATSVLPAGGVALEQGVPDWSREPDDSGALQGKYTADSLFRVGLGGPVELQLGGSAWNHLYGDGEHRTGHGDSSVAMKVAPSTNGDFSYAVLGQVTFDNGTHDIGNGARQYTLGTTLGWKLQGDRQFTVFANLDRLQGSNTWTLAPVYTVPLTDNLQGYVETDLIHDGQDGNEGLAGGGLALKLGERAQADTFVLHRVGPRGAQWEAGLGISVYFGRL
ncbi:transporter [Pinirhizobacter soli]|uniref:transporter n=2 Tax=Pinirhizobacter soli TaxID=2786953 RepID=UPI00202A831C|nr:transporter [Pinirhizobacter soli]